MRIVSVGQVVFAATLVAFGIYGLGTGVFVPLWDAVPTDFPLRGELVYLCAAVWLLCGVGLFFERTVATASRVLFFYTLLWMLVFNMPIIVRAPLVEGSYQNWGETAVLLAGSWVLYAWFAAAWDRRRLGFASGERGVRLARIVYALAMIAFGLSHFAYLNLTAPLIPHFLPWHVGLSYFTGGAYIAAGIAMLIGVCASLAATLSAIQMGIFTFFVWVPLLLSGLMTPDQHGEFAYSWALTAAAWVVADSYREKLSQANATK